MDRDRLRGIWNKAKGAVKKRAGRASGDRKTEAEGRVDKAKGDVQNTAGGMKDKLRDRV